MENLLHEMAPIKQRTLDELIAAGESPTLEYKSSLRWDVRTNQVNKELQKMISKTVAGLLKFRGWLADHRSN